MQKQKIQWIPLNKINPLFEAHVSNAFLERMRKIDPSLQTYDFLLTVEKVPNKDIYLLVSGFDRYRYLQNREGWNEAPCIVEKSGTVEEMHLKVLSRFYPRGDNPKDNKKQLLVLLEVLRVSMQRIVKESCMTMSEIKNSYTYDLNIPDKYITENTVPKTLNEIERLEITTEAKYHLYYKAGLKVGNSDRLTGQVINIIKQFSKDDVRVKLLTSAQQIKTFDQAFNPKKSILKKLKDTLDRFMWS